MTSNMMFWFHERFGEHLSISQKGCLIKNPMCSVEGDWQVQFIPRRSGGVFPFSCRMKQRAPLLLEQPTVA